MIRLAFALTVTFGLFVAGSLWMAGEPQGDAARAERATPAATGPAPESAPEAPRAARPSLDPDPPAPMPAPERPQPAAPAPAPERVAPAPEALVEVEVALAEQAPFVEAPLAGTPPDADLAVADGGDPERAVPDADEANGAGGAFAPGPAPDQDEWAALIRRMLALYERTGPER